MLTGCTKGTGGSAFGPPLLSTSHVDVLTLTVSLYIIKCERRLETASLFCLWSHQDENGLGICLWALKDENVARPLLTQGGAAGYTRERWTMSCGPCLRAAVCCCLLPGSQNWHWGWRWPVGWWRRVRGPARWVGAVSDAISGSCLCISQHRRFLAGERRVLVLRLRSACC